MVLKVCVWMSADIEGTSITSNELYYDIISITDGDNTPVIASSMSSINIQQYVNISIPYVVYTWGSETTVIDLLENDEVVQSGLIVDRRQKVWVYKPTESGAINLSIKSGTVVKNFMLNVTPCNR